MKSKHLLILIGLLISIFSLGQNKASLKQVDSLIQIRQPDAAQKQLWKVIDKAKMTKDNVTLVKAFPYFKQLLGYLDYNERAMLYSKVLQKTKGLPEPAKTITGLQMTEELAYSFYYWFGYAQQKLDDSIDIEDPIVRYDFMLNNILQMEKDLNGLKRYDFKPFAAALSEETDSVYLYRTLSDYVAYHLIYLYENSIVKNGGTLKMAASDKNEWYATTDHFGKLTFQDSTLTSAVLKLYQGIEKNNVDYPPYLSNAIYQRLNYLKKNFNNESVILSAWKLEFNYFKNFSARSKFLFEIVKNKYKEGTEYHFKNNSEVEGMIKEAHNELTAELKKFPNSDVRIELKGLITIIEHQEVQLSYPQITPPNQKIPLLISHRNYSNQVLRIYKIKADDPLQRKSLRGYVKYNQLTLVRTLQLDLKNKHLYQKRSLEMLLDGIESPGEYFIVASPAEQNLSDFAENDSLWNSLKLVSNQLTVSTITATTTMSDNEYSVLVLDQTTGKPIQNAEVAFYYNDYQSNYKPKLLKSGNTDKMGVFALKTKPNNYRNITYVIKYENSVLTGSSYVYGIGEDRAYNVVELFTDRGIYRPGQTIHFKGIAFEGKDNNLKVLPNKTIKISLMDASYQEVFSKTFKTNSFGSIDGEIVLPQHSSLGYFTLIGEIKAATAYNIIARKSISVEEYKRPTFDVTLNQPENEAKLNDSVTVTGNAKAFAGFPIANAQVTYSIYRKWNQYWRFYYTPSSGDLLKVDSLKTDENGSFSIDFFAATDPNAVKNAYYYYEVKVKVTDLSGETHEQSISLKLSKTGLALQFSAPNQILSSDTVFAKINVINLAGKNQDGFNGKLKIYEKVPAKKFLNRIWDRAETSQITNEELVKLYPYMRLNGTTQIENEEKLFKTIGFKSGDSLNINKILDGAQGEFIFKLQSITKDGDTLMTNQTVEVIDIKSKEVPTVSSLWTFISSNTAEVGSSIDFQVGSSFKNTRALVSFYRGQELVSREWVDLKGRYSIDYKVQEEDRGILTYDVILYYNGMFYTDSKRVNVPFSNKVLDIQTTTFRDLLEPGQKEHWSFQVKNDQNMFADAELAAAMYDASLDKIRSNSWDFNPYSARGSNSSWAMNWNRTLKVMSSPGLNWELNQLLNQFDNRIGITSTAYYSEFRRSRMTLMDKSGGLMRANAFGEDSISEEEIAYPAAMGEGRMKDESKKLENDIIIHEVPKETVQLRSNFNETAFFYPTIYANDSNEYVLDFTLPESLTKWKLLLLAHTKDLKTGTLQKEIEARKELMITANAPRFVRQGDQIDFSAKVVNLTDEDQTVEVALKLENPINDEVLNWASDSLVKSVTIPGNSSQEVNWRLNIGEQELMQYTVSASNTMVSDGERNIIPVLSNRIAVTETDHILIKTPGTVTHTFDAFKNQNSATLENKSYTVEYIDNLAWQAVMALPYLSKVNDQSVTSLMNSYYANAIAEHIVNSNPKIKTIFDQWKSQTPDALWSELQKNEELKNILLNETPWVMDAKNEAEQRRRIAQLFELNQLQDNQQGLLKELMKKQNGDGGFPWFSGGRSNIYITNLVLNRIGQLEHLGIKSSRTSNISSAAERYLAQQQVEKYNDYLKYNKKRSRSDFRKYYPFNDMDIYWLYSLTFFPSENSAKLDTIIDIYKEKMQQSWVNFTSYGQALAGIYFKYQGMEKYAQLIYASFLDRAKKNTNIGMYWIENSGYYWYQNKIGTQAMIISFFQGMNAPKEYMDDMRLWLILNKETHSWETGVNTADAIYAILMSGRDYLSSSSIPTIKVGNQELVDHQTANKNEIQVNWTPGLGQVKQQWTESAVNPSMGTVTVDKTSESPAVLNLYWQYTEELSKIKESSNKSMQIHKTYRRIVPGDKDEKGIVDSVFSRGDKIEVELIITVDRDLEYVHIKDLRPAGFEPVMNLSGYHWENYLSYYQSPKDVSMDYFVDYMEKGTYKLTYTVYATHSGKFNSGMASVQCYYAPKFSGNSGTKGVEVKRK